MRRLTTHIIKVCFLSIIRRLELNFVPIEMQKYRTESYSVGCWLRIDDISAEVPQWVYALLFFVSIGVGIGCSYAGPHETVLMPAWSIIFFTGAVLPPMV
jgi:hypothetical protein